MNNDDVFISHAIDDAAFVRHELVPLLTSHSIHAWLAPTAIGGAADWEREILAALKSSERMVVVLTPRAVASKWVRAELAWWFDEKYAPDKKNLIPLLLEPCDWKSLHVMMRAVQYIDCSDGRFSRSQVRRQVTNCFGVNLRLEATTAATLQIAALGAPIVYAAGYHFERGPTSPVSWVVSSNHAWSPDQPARSFTDMIESDLGGGLAALDFGPAVAVAPDKQARGRTFIVFRSGGCVFAQWHPRWKCQYFLKAAVPASPCCAAMLPDDSLALGYADGSVFVVKASERIVDVVQPRAEPVVSIGSSEHSNVVIGWGDGRVEIRPVKSVRFPSKTLELGTRLRSLLCRHDPDEASYFAAGCEDGRIRLIDYDGVTLETLDCSTGPVTHVAANTLERRLSVIAGGHVLQWSIGLSERVPGSYLEFVWPLEIPQEEVVTFMEAPIPRTKPPDAVDSFIVLASRDGTVTRYNVGSAPAVRAHARQAPSW